MADSHLQVNHDGSLENRKTVLWAASESDKKEVLLGIFSQPNWNIDRLDHIEGSYWKVETHNQNISFKINLYVSSVRDEARQPDEFKMQLGAITPINEDGWVTLIMGVYTISHGAVPNEYILSAYNKDRFTFSTNPSIRGTRTIGLQKAKILGLYKTDISYLFRPEFIYFYLQNQELLNGDTSDKFEENENIEGCAENNLQTIFYGCPGSGKSHQVNKLTATYNEEGFVGLSSFERQQAYQKYLDDKHGHKKTYKGGGTNIYALTHPKLMGYISSCTEFEISSLFEISNEEDFNAIMEALKDCEAYQNDSITKGSGCHWETGLKSYGEFLKDQNLNTEPRKDAVFRTTFHPDTDYAAFVGCYKPSMNDGIIEYSFTPQVFTNAYIAAWENTKKPVYLVIEEINRGNCAQIFGDLFQLLDRDKMTGKSEYPIKADKDLVAYIEKVLGAGHEGIKNGELCLPSNLIIYATMNTSDQSLFPMDSAFKRRWDWMYVPINYSKDIDSGKFTIKLEDNTEYLWVEFLEKVNDKIYNATNSEDKQMGNFFIKKSVDAKEFINKVMFYLWNEVCKEEYGTQRNFFRKGKDGKIEFKFTELFGADQTPILKEFMKSLDVEPTNKPNPEEPIVE